MKIFTNKNMIQKLAIVLVIILICGFVLPGTVRAEDEGIGGKLLNPVMSLFVSIADGIMTFIQEVIFHFDISMINLDTGSSFLADIIVIVTAIVIVAVAIAAILASGGSAVTIGFSIGKMVIEAAVVTTITFPITTSLVEEVLPETFHLPLFEVTPYEIFSDKIPLLDVDFFNPMEEKVVGQKTETVQEEHKRYSYDLVKIGNDYFTYDISLPAAVWKLRNQYEIDTGYPLMDSNLTSVPEWSGNWVDVPFERQREYMQYFITMEKILTGIDYNGYENSVFMQEPYCTTITTTTTKEVATDITEKSTAKELQSTVSGWYVVLRDISLVALLSVLVYIGIRILLSSASSDKAKYKQMLMDWVVAICLLFVMQYIMSFSNIIVGKVTDVLDAISVNANLDSETEQPELYEISAKDKVKKAYEILVQQPVDEGSISSKEESPYYQYFTNEDKSGSVLRWPAENFMQQARINLQLLDGESNETYVSIGWKLIYVLLVIYTVIFLFTYIKRVIYMAFLTLIAPLVALTYPIDKINDGKAQAFNTWFREYIFNLLLQPMHLLLYTILIGSAMTFASQNIVYVAVALGFMVPAEKLLRKFFGFEKAQTPGAFAGVAGGAAMMSAMKWLTGKAPGPGPKGGKGGPKDSTGESGDDNKPPKLNNGFDTTASLIGDGSDNSNSQGVNQQHQQQENSGDNEEEQRDLTLERYNSEGYSQNNNGEYFNPWTDEYDANYDPHNDPTYLEKAEEQQQQQQQLQQHQQQEPIRQQPRQSNTPQRTTRSIGRALKTTGKYYARGLRDKAVTNISNGVRNMHPLRTGVRVATGVAGAATVATGGLIAGIATGDGSKAAQYTGVAAAAGYKLGGGVGGNVTSALSVPGTSEAMKQAYYGSSDEYKKAEMEKYVDKMKKDRDNLLKLEMAGYNKKQSKEFMDNVMPTYSENGITDFDDIMAAYELEQKQLNNDRNMAIAIAKYGNRIGDTTKMSDKTYKEHTDTLKRDFTDRVGKEKAEQLAPERMRMVDQYYKYKNN